MCEEIDFERFHYMDNMITGALAVIVFGAFVVGLALSIGQTPFMIIVGLVLALLVIDYVQNVRSENDNNKPD